MQVNVTFNSELAATFLKAIIEGRAIDPPFNGWTTDARLTLGACLTASVGVALKNGVDPVSYEVRPRQEDQIEAAERCVGYAAGMLIKPATELIAGRYQEQFDPVVMFAIDDQGHVPYAAGVKPQ